MISSVRTIEYSVITGKLYRGGVVVGCTATSGYTVIWYNRKLWLAHRLAYHLLGAELPANVDHANGTRSDNRWLNLRDACAKTNQEARHAVVGASGLMGVYLRADTGKYQAKIKTNGRSINIGCFDTAAEVGAAYQRKKAEVHTLHPH